MRPRFLEIEGLQSFKENVLIDFDKLSETGLFGIFGPTGSGKSTVLDAITLSLYGKVTRAERGTQGIINTSSKRLRVAFSFDILKADKRQTYKVERVFSRKKGTENFCECKIARLIEIDREMGENIERPLSDKHTEVTSKVEELLGLNHDDFIRAVVLPQNKFQEFLMMEKAKKREMLERIFYLEEYGRELGEKVSKKKNILENAKNSSLSKLSVLADASNESLENATKLFKMSSENKDAIEKEIIVIEKKFNISKEIWGLMCEKKEIEETNKEYDNKKEENDIKSARLLKAQRAAIIQNEIKKFEEEEKKYNDTNKELLEVSKKLINIKNDAELAQNKLLVVKEESRLQVPILIEKKSHLNLALALKKEVIEIDKNRSEKAKEYKTIISRKDLIEKEKELSKIQVNDTSKIIEELINNLDSIKVDLQYKDSMVEIVRIEDDLAFLEKAYNESLKVFEGENKRLNELKEKYEILENDLKKARDEYTKLEEFQIQLKSQKPCEKEKVDERNNLYIELKSQYEKLVEKELEANRLNLLIEAEKNTILENNLQKATTLKEMNTLKIEISNLDETLKNLTEEINRNVAIMLAKNLKINEKCPVCGSLEHPELARGEEVENTDEDKKRMERIQLNIVNLEKDFNLKEKLIFEITFKITKACERSVQLNNELNEKKEIIEEIKKRMPLEFALLSTEEIGERITLIKSEYDKDLKLLGKWEKDMDLNQSKMLESNKILLDKTVIVQGVGTEIKVNHKNIESLINRKNEAFNLVDEKKKELFKELEKYKIKSGKIEYKKIMENEKLSEQIRNKIQESQESVKKQQEIVLVMEKNISELSNSLSVIEMEGKNLRQQIDEKNIKIRELAGEVVIEDEIENVDKKIYQLEKRSEMEEHNVNKIITELNSINIQKSSLERQKEIFGKIVDKERIRIDEQLKDKGFKDSTDFMEAILEEKQIKVLEEEIRLFEQGLKNIEAQKAMIDSKLRGRNILESEWISIKQEYEDILKEKESVFGEFQVKKNIYETVKIRNKEWNEINNDCKVYTNKLELLAQLQNILRGNNFIDFVAEKRLRYIAKEASQLFGVLTNYRFDIEIDGETQFVIRDNSNGGIHRMVTTLSGGETFLAALSLALALSKHIQLKGQSPLEFFFLDEGFGTLDNTLLDTVMDSLEKLSTKERVIGLISHVPDLRLRIARRLIITPPGRDGCGSKASIETYS